MRSDPVSHFDAEFLFVFLFKKNFSATEKKCMSYFLEVLGRGEIIRLELGG